MLIEDIQTVIGEILRIHNLELEAVMRGDYTAREDSLVRLAQVREHKALLIQRYRQHVETHGC
jgi:hypothetical protein